MRDVLLSICISSYNKGSRCTQLVRDLLSITDNRFNIFICDDCSDNATVQKLCELQGGRVVLIRNKKNEGPCKNWYKTIDCGNGKYILQVLDRDDINADMIPIILDALEKSSSGAGYIGKSVINLVQNRKKGRFAIYQKGKEAFLAMAGIPIHPTGFLISKETWKQGQFKKFFYQDEKYGIYPHSYVLGITAAKQDMFYMPVSFCTYKYRGENGRSAFYQKTGQENFWWLPDHVMQTANQLILYLYHIADEEFKEEFVIRRWQEGLVRATRGYRATVMDKNEMEHYGVDTHDVSGWELIAISVKYYFVFKFVLNKLHLRNRDIKKQINRIWIEHLKTLLELI